MPTGNVMRIIAPPPSRFITATEPPWAAEIAEAIDNPRPLPAVCRERALSARQKRSKLRVSGSGAKLGPRLLLQAMGELRVGATEPHSQSATGTWPTDTAGCTASVSGGDHRSQSCGE
jgi:hypothetical protein